MKHFGFKKILILIGILFLFGYIFFISSHGILINDEGYIIYGAQRILNGQIPYKDFDFAYTPASLYLTAVSFKIFGVSIISSRILMIIITVVGAYVMYRLLTQFVTNKFYIALGICSYIFWGIGHINFPWPVMLAIPTGLIHSFFLYKFVISKKIKFALLAGLFVTITFLIKQNFGVVLCLQTAVCFLFFKELRTYRFIAFYLIGIFISLFPYALYLVITNSLSSFISNFYTYTIVRIVIEKTLDTPFLYEDSPYGIFMKLFFYVLPFYLGCIAFVKSIQYNRKFLIIVFLVVLYYFFGIRPTTDYPHLVPLLALSSILLPFIVIHAKRGIEKYILFTFFIIFVGLGLWTSIYKNYYRYERPLSESNAFVSDPKVLVWVPHEKKEMMRIFRKEITQNTTPDQKIFVYFYAPFIYYLTERNNVSSYDIHPSHEKMLQYNTDVIVNLEKNKTKYVVTYGKISNLDKWPIAQYIQKHYIPKIWATDYLIWQRKTSMVR